MLLPNKFNLKEKRKNANQGTGHPGDALDEAALWAISCDPSTARGEGIAGEEGSALGALRLGREHRPMPISGANSESNPFFSQACHADSRKA